MEKDRKKRRRRIRLAVLAGCSVLALAAALYLFLVPIDLTGYHESIESLIEARTGRAVRFDRIVLKALPSPDLNVRGIRVFHGSEEVIGVRALRVRLSLLPLFLNRFIIEDLHVTEPEVGIRRDEAGALNLTGLLAASGNERRGGPAVKVKSLTIDKGRVRFLDEAVPGRPSYDIRDINARLDESANGFRYRAEGRLMPDARFSVTGEGNERTWSFSGSGALKGLDLSYLNPYIRREAPEASVKGTVDLDLSFSLAQDSVLRGTVRYRDLVADYPAALGAPLASSSGGAGIRYSRTGGKTDLSMDNARFVLPDFSLSGSLSLSGAGEDSLFSLAASTTPIPLKTFKALIPLKTLPPAQAEMIGGLAPLGGEVTISSLKAAGRASELKTGGIFRRPDALSISVLLKDIGFRYSGFNEAFSGISGAVALRGGELALTEITGRYNRELIKRLSGRLWDLTGKARYDLAMKGTFDAGESLGMAREMTRDEGLRETLGKTYASGEIDLDLKVSGALKSKAAPAYSGSSEIIDGGFSYQGFPLKLQALNGYVSFDGERLSIRELTGTDGNSSFLLNGDIEGYAGKSPLFSLKAEGALSADTVKPFLKDRPLEGLSFGGSVTFRAALTGSRDSFDAEALCDATPADLTYRKAVRKETDYPMALEAAFGVRGNELLIKGADLSFGGSSVTISGTALKDRSSYRLSLNSKGVRLSDIANVTPYLSKEYESEGLVSFKINTVKEGRDEAPSYDGKIRVEEARFKTPFIARPVEKINAVARFNGNKANIAVDRVSAGTTELSGKLDILDIAGRVIRFEVSSPRLNAEDLVPAKGVFKKEPAKPSGRKGRPVTGGGVIDLRGGSLWGHRFGDLHTEVALEEDAITFSPLSFFLDNGSAAGELKFYRDPAEAVLFETEIGISNIHLETTLAGFGVKGKALSGDLQGTARISGARGASPFASGLNGEIILYSDKGKLWKFPVLSSVFSVVNIISIDELFKEGLPYKTISGDFSVNDGIIFTDDMIFDSDSMRMSAHGTIDLPRLHLDSVLALHPFVTIDKIISKIPLAGWIITGREKSTVSMYFEIAGPLNDPKVEPKPIKTLEKGVIGIFERLLEAPAEILLPGQDKDRERRKSQNGK